MFSRVTKKFFFAQMPQPQGCVVVPSILLQCPYSCHIQRVALSSPRATYRNSLYPHTHTPYRLETLEQKKNIYKKTQTKKNTKHKK